MCGITGFFEPGGSDLRLKTELMLGRLKHRGPDDSGVWTHFGLPMALGHNRLSILDLSPLGHQPMLSASGRFVITFNGEVYNFRQLAAELNGRGHSFKGHSDTEVMLAAFEEWGVHGAVERFIGMFAFAVWDEKEHRLSLVRDRLGIKPLYYGWSNGVFAFGSEVSAIRAHPHTRLRLNLAAVDQMLRHQYIPGPLSIYRDIYKLQPGSILTLNEADMASEPIPPGELGERLRSYWSLAEVVAGGVKRRFQGNVTEAADELQRLLRDSVSLRMIADVPLGAFLSGGIDSSLVVSIMQELSTRPVRTFCIGFGEAAYDESAAARKVAAHLRTEHTEQILTAAEALEIIPNLPKLLDEPHGDSSFIPTYLVSQLARRSVTVALSGDGGDELCGGYSRYQAAATIWHYLGWLPIPLRKGLITGLRTVPFALRKQLVQLLDSSSGMRPGIRSPDEKFERLMEILHLGDFQELYSRLLTTVPDGTKLLQRGESQQPALVRGLQDEALSTLEMMMIQDTVRYLPDAILTKVDRASMVHGLEARVPLLDHRVVEFFWSLPVEFRATRKRSKLLLRKVLERFVPADLTERPKQGFGIPVAAWLRKELRSWGGDLLNSDQIRRHGILDEQMVERLWTEHQSGTRDRSAVLWNILMLQGWLNEQRI